MFQMVTHLVNSLGTLLAQALHATIITSTSWSRSDMLNATHMIDQYWTVKMYANAMLASFMAFASSIAADGTDVHSTVDSAPSANSSRRPGS